MEQKTNTSELIEAIGQSRKERKRKVIKFLFWMFLLNATLAILKVALK